MTQRNVAPRMIGTDPVAAVAVTRKLLRPLVRLFLDYGVVLPALVEVLKETYVDVAERDLRVDGREQSDSRLSVMTGIHRKDVRRLRRAPGPTQSALPSVLIGGQLVARWIGHPDYLDAHGKPLRLPRFKRDGGARSFEALAESVSRDVGPRAILDELLRLGIARTDSKRRICLEVAAFAPRTGVEKEACYFADNLRDHIAVAVHNLRGDGPPFLERSVHCMRLSPRSVTELKRLAERIAMRGLQQLDRRATSLKHRDRGEKAHNLRMNFGMFFYREEAPEENGEGRMDTNVSRRNNTHREQNQFGKSARLRTHAR